MFCVYWIFHIILKTSSHLRNGQNYVDQNLPILDQYLPIVGDLWRNYSTIKQENLHTVDISTITYLPRLFNVVCERPLMLIFDNFPLSTSILNNDSYIQATTKVVSITNICPRKENQVLRKISTQLSYFVRDLYSIERYSTRV